MAYFDCQIVQGGGGMILTVTCNSVFAGATITATDGETTLQATCPSSSPYTVEFKIPNSGSWTISGTASGQTGSTTVVIPDSATLTPPIPTGSTVTPVNDIQTWLHCANVWDKTYTTIAQVLTDTSLVTTLIASNNAVDYMARSTSWASAVCADSSAMTKIGANDYCADTLLSVSTWLNAIRNSTYFERVLNVKIPTMTGSTSPYGEVNASSVYSSAQAAYMAFDSIVSTEWSASNGGVNEYVSYTFTTPVKVYLAKITQRNRATPKRFTWCIKAKNNGSWETVSSTFYTNEQTGNPVFNVDVDTNSNAYTTYALWELATAGDYACIAEVQLYGRASS